MATLVVSTTANFSLAALNNIDAISFTNEVSGAAAAFANTQFNNVAILNNVLVTGSSAANGIIVNGGSVNASGWTFASWTADVDTITLGGGAGNDAVIGSSQRDVLNGGGGNDILYGGAAVDDCFGEEGDDTFKLTGSDLGDNVYGGEGSDVLDLSGWTNPNVGFLVNLASLFYRYQPNASGADGIYDLSGIEHVRGSNFSDTITGDAQANIIVGGGGIDSMAGAAGDDRYYVDDPNDNIIELAGAGTGFDTIFASVSYTMGPNVERIYLIGDFGRAAYGRDGENDYLYGNSRENILDGKSGADYMSGGIGNDSYYVDTSGDVVYEAPGGLAGTSDTIFARTSYTMPANVEGLYLLGGGDYNANGRNGKLDYLHGNSGNNILNGLSGGDYMTGGLGDDTYYANTSADSIDEDLDAGFDTVFAQSGFSIPLNVERLYLLNGGNYYANGIDFQNDFLAGNDGANSINGHSGNDIIRGGLGNDTLTGGTGLDIFQFLTAPNAALNLDVIADFSAADDTIQIDNLFYTAAGAAGALSANLFKNLNLGVQDADDRILYDDTTGALYYDNNGLAAGGVIQFAALTGSPTVTAADFVVV